MYIKIIVNVKYLIKLLLLIQYCGGIQLCPVIAENLSKPKLVDIPNMSNKFNNNIHLNVIWKLKKKKIN